MTRIDTHSASSLGLWTACAATAAAVLFLGLLLLAPAWIDPFLVFALAFFSLVVAYLGSGVSLRTPAESGHYRAAVSIRYLTGFLIALALVWIVLSLLQFRPILDPAPIPLT